MKPQLTLRDLFWLVLVAACFCGWGVDHAVRMYNANRLARLERLVGVLEDQGCELFFDESATGTTTGVSWPRQITERDDEIQKLKIRIRQLERESMSHNP